MWKKEKRRYLSDLFFSKESWLSKDGAAHKDCLAFLERLETVRQRKTTSDEKKSRSSTEILRKSAVNDLGLPNEYNVALKSPLVADGTNIREALRDGITRMGTTGHRETVVEPREVQQFYDDLSLYADFVQRQKLDKLRKLRQSQRNLPMYQFKEELLNTLEEHDVVVVAGDTGCGKSTQVPQYLLEAGFTNIACTQPRRIACISLAKRVSFETLNEHGSEVAYQVRFDKSATRQTRIVFLTEGLLLRHVQSDGLLDRYDVIVLDEVHERHIHTDFLLGVMKCLLRSKHHRKTKQLKVVLMSATINVELFSSYFDDCPVISVPGRLYPISVQHWALREVERTPPAGSKINAAPYLRVLQLIDQKYPADERGDCLVFLSGTAEIQGLIDELEKYAAESQRWIILPLHSLLAVDEQDRVFDVAPEGVRKCIVSTNIAETSVTIDGVRFIVDSGKVKEICYDAIGRLQKLQEFWVSKASAEQRKGRAGRTGPGVCFRLYSTSDLDSFQDYSTPEIQRVPLESLVLQMLSMGLPDARQFPFIEPPDVNTLEGAIVSLRENGALDQNSEQLSPLGHMLAQLPVDVFIGKMLVMGSIFEMADVVLTAAAALSVQSPLCSHRSNLDAADARKSLESDHGDPFTLLNMYSEWLAVKRRDSTRASRKWCKRRGLEEQRFYEMSKLRRQFIEIMLDHRLWSGRAAERVDNFSSADRKRLNRLRRQHRYEEKRRKVLKMGSSSTQAGSSDEDEEKPEKDGDDVLAEIKDLEFRLADSESIAASDLSQADFAVLKLMLVSGLYPHLAVSDEYNNFKADNEQLFHSKSKQFLTVHPTSVFAWQPDLLALASRDIRSDLASQVPNTKGAAVYSAFSSKHQMIAYVGILETRKPFMLNCMRVPTLQTLLLFAQRICTSLSVGRLIVDDWLELIVPGQVASAHKSLVNMLVAAIHLRRIWANVIQTKLQEFSTRREDSVDEHFHSQQLNQNISTLQKHLSAILYEYLYSSMAPAYSVRRVMPTEVNRVVNDDDGERLSEYLLFDCLTDDESHADEYEWTCVYCDKTRQSTARKQLKHALRCDAAELGLLNTASQSSSESAQDITADTALSAGSAEMAGVQPVEVPGVISYFCDECIQHLTFSSRVQLLRHKKSHQSV